MQAIDAAVSAAVVDATEKAVNKTKAEVEAIQAAQKAAADTQSLRELEDKCAALSAQVASLQDNLLATESALRCAPSENHSKAHFDTEVVLLFTHSAVVLMITSV